MNPIKFLLCSISYSLNCWHKANSVVEGRMHAIGLLSQRFDMTSLKGISPSETVFVISELLNMLQLSVNYDMNPSKF